MKRGDSSSSEPPRHVITRPISAFQLRPKFFLVEGRCCIISNSFELLLILFILPIVSCHFLSQYKYSLISVYCPNGNMQKCYQIYKLVSLVLGWIITLISVCMNKKLLQNRVVNSKEWKNLLYHWRIFTIHVL